jgi:hypothetical protein
MNDSKESSQDGSSVSSADRSPLKRASAESRKKLRIRMRIAQRTHRSRKETEQLQMKERVGNLTTALESIVDVFAKFHGRCLALESERMPASLTWDISNTALQIASISQQAMKKPDILEKVQSEILDEDIQEREVAGSAMKRTELSDPMAQEARSPESNIASRSRGRSAKRLHRPIPVLPSISMPPQEFRNTSTSFEDRYLRACLQRSYRLLMFQALLDDEVFPAMMIPLQIESLEACRAMARNALSVSKGHLGDFYFHTTAAMKKLPRMFRVIEGQDSHILPRFPPPLVQTIEYGRTRTRLATDLPELQGDWLEAADVLEYLEHRGIQLSRVGKMPSSILIPRGCFPLAPRPVQSKCHQMLFTRQG